MHLRSQQREQSMEARKVHVHCMGRREISLINVARLLSFVITTAVVGWSKGSSGPASASALSIFRKRPILQWMDTKKAASLTRLDSLSLRSLGARHFPVSWQKSATLRPTTDPLIGHVGKETRGTASTAADDLLKIKEVNQDNSLTDHMIKFTNPVCRVVAVAGGKLPKYEKNQNLANAILGPHHMDMLDKLDAIFHAKAHEDTRRFRYMQRSSFDDVPPVPPIDGTTETTSTEMTMNDYKDNEGHEKHLIVTLRQSLEDSGFDLLSKRDYDLCEALNAGYLLRLSILPDVSQADPAIYQAFYPEQFQQNGTVKDEESSNWSDDEDLLFGGRVLIFWRGYSREVTRGRLLLPKLDYLQANLVQRSAAYLAKSIGRVERLIWRRLRQSVTTLQRSFFRGLSWAVNSIPGGESFAKILHDNMATKWNNDIGGTATLSSSMKISEDEAEHEARPLFRLGRYGGSKIRFIGSPNPKDALNPFLICDVAAGGITPPCPNAHNHYISQIERSRSLGGDLADRQPLPRVMNNGLLGKNDFTCLYDAQSKNPPRATQLLERVSISDVVDSFSRAGRARLLANFFAKSELVEPSFDEVVVVWRPLPESVTTKRERIVLPKVVYDLADIFDIEGLPQPIIESSRPTVRPLEIRAFHQVPMANLLAVLPKTKLVFRPADAFVFDFVSVTSFLLILGSQRFDSPKLDFLALVSVAFWIIRTFFRYRNKLISYDLLVKTFFTSKISHRNAGALKYVTNEAGSARARRAAIVYAWLLRRMASFRSTFVGNKPIDLKVVRAQLEREGEPGVNDLLRSCDKPVRVDMSSALNDLEELHLVTFSENKTILNNVVDPIDAIPVLRETWTNLL